ncbi:MAG: hypothetical protein JW726_19190 [Anaerolineales bacterium]|nr:hypothetical protein [Anaerolineales bacterium]
MYSSPLLGRGIWHTPLWIGVGLIFLLLSLLTGSSPRSPLWFTEPLLYVLIIGGLWANLRFGLRQKIPLPRRLAPLAYILLSWLFGMLFEASLTLTGEGIGGIHPQTLPSFLLAQGDYLPIALVSWFVIRKQQLTFREAFFLAGGKSLTEGLLFTGALARLLLSPQFFLAPLTLAYYTLAYSTFIALPLLFINEQLLWQPRPPARRFSIPSLWLLGFLLALAIRLFWGLWWTHKTGHLPKGEVRL